MSTHSNLLLSVRFFFIKLLKHSQAEIETVHKKIVHFTKNWTQTVEREIKSAVILTNETARKLKLQNYRNVV